MTMNFRVAQMFAGLVYFCFTPGGALAAAPQFMDGFKLKDVASVLQEFKITDVKQETIENDPRLSFKIGETNFVADLYECDDKIKGCKALQFVIAYEPDGTDTVQAANEYNRVYLYGKAAIDKDGGLISSRMVNGHAGISRAQIAAEFDSFIGATEVLLEHMKKSALTAQARIPQAPTLLNAPLAHQRPARSSRWNSVPRNRR